MNVIAKIRCYFECNVVTVKLRKEYLNTATYNTPVLLWIKKLNSLMYRLLFCVDIIWDLQTLKQQSGFWPTLYNQLPDVSMTLKPFVRMYLMGSLCGMLPRPH